MTGPRYPWLLPSDHPLYRPFYGFARPMTGRDYRRALAALSRTFVRDLAAYDARKWDHDLTLATILRFKATGSGVDYGGAK